MNKNEPPNGQEDEADLRPAIIFTKKQWRRIRDAKWCEHFTDEELENADKKMQKIKTGWVGGQNNVDFWIDPQMPTLHTGGDVDKFKLKAGYSE